MQAKPANFLFMIADLPGDVKGISSLFRFYVINYFDSILQFFRVGVREFLILPFLQRKTPSCIMIRYLHKFGKGLKTRFSDCLFVPENQAGRKGRDLL